MRSSHTRTLRSASDPIRVLLVDGSPGDAELARAMLADSRSLAFQVRTARTLGAATKALGQSAHDVVILDLTLPDSSGVETLWTLRQTSTDVPVVVMTAIENEDLALRVLRAGADSYLVKGETSTSLLVRMLWHAIERQRLYSDLAHAKEREREAATHDALTGLPNRTVFHERLGQATRTVNDGAPKLATLVIDIDRLRRVNDSFGYAEGDLFLRIAAERIGSCLRSHETFSRIGGDEFGIILTGFGKEIDAARVAERVLGAFHEPIEVGTKSCVLTASVGIAIHPTDGADAQSLVSSAELALYQAKAVGGDRYEFYRPDLNASAAERLDLENDLRKALVTDQLIVHYQPKVDCRRMEWCGSEALVRWKHPESGMLPPGKFIPVAEEAGLIGALGRWVLGAACRQGRDWKRQCAAALPVSVNVSVRQFEDGDLVHQVLTELERSGLDPTALELEITESTLMADVEKVRTVMQELKGHGVRFSIDDFGTGYSSLAVLRSLPVDVIKIDRSFVSRTTEDERDARLAETIVTLAQALGVQTIAEGVETPDQADLLVEIGCDYLQGFLFSPPVAEDDLEPLLADRRVSWEKPQ